MNISENPETQRAGHHPHVGFIQVSVYTTSGAYPRHGQEQVKATEIVAEFLQQAARALHLTDTAGWVASVGGRDIDPSLSFAANHLAGTAKIHWGPREGGGG